MLQNENQIFWKNIQKIKDSLLMSDEQFAKELEIDLKVLRKIFGTNTLLPLDKAFLIAEKHNFHFEDLFQESFKLKFANGPTSLLNRYSYAMHSHTKPIMSIINYLEKVKGTRAKINILRKFQLSEEFVENDTHKTNIFLVSDIAKHIQTTFQFTNEDFIKMGQTTPFVTRNEFLYSKLTGHRNVQAMLEYCYDECSHIFDKNVTYKLEMLNDEVAIVAAIPKKEVVEELEVDRKLFGSIPSSYNRAGIISSMSMFQFDLYTPVQKISCIHHGDAYDRYALDLNLFRKSARPNLRLVH